MTDVKTANAEAKKKDVVVKIKTNIVIKINALTLMNLITTRATFLSVRKLDRATAPITQVQDILILPLGTIRSVTTPPERKMLPTDHTLFLRTILAH